MYCSPTAFKPCLEHSFRQSSHSFRQRLAVNAKSFAFCRYRTIDELSSTTDLRSSELKSSITLLLSVSPPSMKVSIFLQRTVRVREGLFGETLCECVDPLFAVLIAALPVPAREDVLASLTAVTSFSSQMGFRNGSCVKIGSENFVPGVLAPGCIGGHSPHLYQSQVCVSFQYVCVLLCSRDDQKGYSVPCHSCHELQLCHTMPISIAVLTVMKQREIITKLLSVCTVIFRLKGNEQGEPIRTTVSAVDCPDGPTRCKDRILSHTVR